MSDEGHPALTALLGLLAVAGYQNRDKLAAMFKGATASANSPGEQASSTGPSGGGLSGILGSLGGASVGSALSTGFNELINRFNQTGHKELTDSWVGAGQNQPANEAQVTNAIGADVLARLSEKTGLPSDEIARRLAAVLPEAVDKYTPDGRLPGAS